MPSFFRIKTKKDKPMTKMNSDWKIVSSLCCDQTGIITRRSRSCRSFTGKGLAVPPVSPEVIKILLFQRSRRQLDAPAEHVKPRELCDGRMFQ
jgi:hypothetical protein